MYNKNVKNYRQTNIETSDRGKLIIMIYDHCIKWCKKAIESINENNIQEKTKAIFKAQDGITELMCSLDQEKGGDIAKNLYRLYDFYSRHLTEGNLRNNVQNVEEVIKMLEELRSAWVICVDNVRKSAQMDMSLSQKSYVSLVG